MNLHNKPKRHGKRGIHRATMFPARWLPTSHGQRIGILVLLFVIFGGLFGMPLAQAAVQQCTSLLQDGGFENGTGWSIQTSGNYALLSDYLAYEGVRAAYLAGTDNAQDRVSATIALPAEKIIRLSFWWQVHTEEEGSDYDGMTVLVADAAGNPLKALLALSNVDATDVWQQSEIDLTEFAGQTIQLQFRAQTDETLTTDFFIDNVALNACSSASSGFNIFMPFTSKS